ncbi:cys-loop ligand-gated ion channel-like [Littorina saxatilis]|uniref:Neurotransmitter-gated ion-channel ligand-binding domain-containing protein n=1 Tax=Littorina saxatilis TaxID=31220 RepID=A0AAN9FZV2_9CAEN
MAEFPVIQMQKSTVQLLQSKEAREVQLRVVYIKLDEIVTIQEQFSGIVFLRARWREPTLDNTTVRDVDKVNWAACWDPKLDIQNVKGEPKASKWRELEFGPNGEVYVVERLRVKGAFAEQMELAHFPFDLQDLSVLVTSELKEHEIHLVEDEHDISIVDINAFADDQEWDLHPCVWTEPKVTVKSEYTQFAHSKPGLYFKCCATRLAGYFVWNIMFVMSVISLLSLVTFAVSRTLPQNRIQLSFILMLASVTFKFAASNSVPKISYLTHLDRYILSLFIFTFLIAAWHGVVTRWKDYPNVQEDLDFWAFVCFIILYVLIHVGFIIIMMFSGYRRRSFLIAREQEYTERAANLTGKLTSKKKKTGGLRRGLARVGFV